MERRDFLSRAAAGGELHLQSAPQRGTRIEARIPFAPEADLH